MGSSPEGYPPERGGAGPVRRAAPHDPGPYHLATRASDRSPAQVTGREQEETSVSRVAIVTDSAADLNPDEARSAGITMVPLVVTFGSESFKAGTEMTTEQFWQRMTAPSAPFPTTAASSPGDFRATYEQCFADGAEAVVSIHVAASLSGTMKSAQIARDMLPDREIHIVDSQGVSMGEGILALMGVEMAEAGSTAAEIAEVLRRRSQDINLLVVVETLEYLKKGGRISAAQAAIGSFMSVKPIIRVAAGQVETVDRVRTRAKARQRIFELIAERPVERISILHTISPDLEEFREELLSRLPGEKPDRVSVELVGASVGPHLGPGCLGAAILYRS
jgi:DegV family protein with EDD domain